MSIKAFTRWLRTVQHELTRRDDPTADLVVPRRPPAKSVAKKGYEVQHVVETYSAISPWRYVAGNGHAFSDVQPVRDVICICAKTGMHLSELGRLARGEGRIEECPPGKEIVAIVTGPHKNGFLHPWALDAQCYAALKRLMARGNTPVNTFIHTCLERAAGIRGIPKINPGALRHSLATWARRNGKKVTAEGEGMSREDVAEMFGHDVKTNEKYYFEGEPKLANIPGLILEHPQDPPLV